MYSGWAFVDCDGTLIDADDNPRPHIKTLLETIKELNLISVVWSGGGKEYAKRVVRSLGYDHYIDHFMWKGTPIQFNHIKPVWFVDDSLHIRVEHTTEGEQVYLVPFYYASIMQDDKHLLSASASLRVFMQRYNKGGARRIAKETVEEIISIIQAPSSSG